MNNFDVQKNDSAVKVSVIMITYNHELYIADAIMGILKQENNFKTELIIADDASSDKSPVIISEFAKNYPQLIITIFRAKNIGANANWLEACNLCRGDYIAVCEGDDYWIDKHKLQKQVDFLEANPDYGLISGGIELIDESNNPLPPNLMISDQLKRQKMNPTFFDLLEVNLINTPTICVRSNILRQLNCVVQKEKLWFAYDYWFWLNIAIKNKIFITKDKYAAYRIHNLSISRAASFLKKRYPEVILYSIKEYIKSRKVTSASQKNLLVKLILWIFLNTSHTWKLRSRSFIWILNHPFYILTFFKSVIL